MTTAAQFIVLCIPRTDGGAAVPPCGLDSAGTAYVPVMQSVTLPDPSTLALLEAASAPVNWDLCLSMFATGFGSIVLVYVTAWAGAQVLKAVG